MVEGIIKIDGKEVRFASSAGTIRAYRNMFHRDLLLDMRELAKAKKDGSGMTPEQLEMFENASFIMAKQGAEKHGEPFPATPDEWLDQFSIFSIYNVFPFIEQLWASQNETLVTPKNGQEQQTVS